MNPTALAVALVWGCGVAAVDSTQTTYVDPPSCAGGTLYVGGTLLDADQRIPAGALCEIGGTIAWLTDDAGAADFAGADAVVDITGRFLIPGLVDAHVHLATAGTTVATGDALDLNLRANLAFGITQVVDLGGPTSLFSLRDRLAADPGASPAPRVYATGPFLTAVGSHPCETFPDANLCTFVEPFDAGQVAEDRAAEGADAIKVAVADAAFTPWGATPRLDLDALESIVAVGLPVFAHVDTEQDALDARARGVSVLAHPPFDAELSEVGAADLVDIPVITTISAFGQVGDLMDGTFDPDDPTLLVSEATRENWREVRANPDLLLPGWVDANAHWTDAARANVATLADGGGTILPGSDAGYLFVPHGSGLHRELRELQALGASAHEVLVAATALSRDTLGLPGGRLGVGQPADFVLLRADPDLDVANLAAIDTVVVAGHAWTHDEIVAFEQADAALDAGEGCVASNECTSGRCDALSHACAPACDPAWALRNECGADAWCMPESGVSTDAVGVCHSEETCDLYAQDCSPAAYAMACIPYDYNTNACWWGGSREVGERCDESSTAEACRPGLYCSPVDARCYALCDPDGSDICDGITRCTAVANDADDPWFGLCL